MNQKTSVTAQSDSCLMGDILHVSVLHGKSKVAVFVKILRNPVSPRKFVSKILNLLNIF